MPRREPELVEALDVLRLGDADPQRLAVEGERDRAHALEHGERDQLRRLGVDALDREVDQRHVVLLGEVARDAERVREALVEERARERAALRAGAHGLELVRREQPAVADDLRDELAVVLGVLGRAERRGADERGAAERRPAERGVAERGGPPSRSSPSSGGTGRSSGSPRRSATIGLHLHRPQVRVEDRSPAKSATRPPSARNGPKGIRIFLAARPCRAIRTTRRNEREIIATKIAIGTVRPSMKPSSSASFTSPIPIPPGRRAPRGRRTPRRRARRAPTRATGRARSARRGRCRRRGARSGSG